MLKQTCIERSVYKSQYGACIRNIPPAKLFGPCHLGYVFERIGDKNHEPFTLRTVMPTSDPLERGPHPRYGGHCGRSYRSSHHNQSSYKSNSDSKFDDSNLRRNNKHRNPSADRLPDLGCRCVSIQKDLESASRCAFRPRGPRTNNDAKANCMNACDRYVNSLLSPCEVCSPRSVKSEKLGKLGSNKADLILRRIATQLQGIQRILQSDDSQNTPPCLPVTTIPCPALNPNGERIMYPSKRKNHFFANSSSSGIGCCFKSKYFQNRNKRSKFNYPGNSGASTPRIIQCVRGGDYVNDLISKCIETNTQFCTSLPQYASGCPCDTSTNCSYCTNHTCTNPTGNKIKTDDRKQQTQLLCADANIQASHTPTTVNQQVSAHIQAPIVNAEYMNKLICICNERHMQTYMNQRKCLCHTRTCNCIQGQEGTSQKGEVEKPESNVDKSKKSVDMDSKSIWFPKGASTATRTKATEPTNIKKSPVTNDLNNTTAKGKASILFSLYNNYADPFKSKGPDAIIPAEKSIFSELVKEISTEKPYFKNVDSYGDKSINCKRSESYTSHFTQDSSFEDDIINISQTVLAIKVEPTQINKVQDMEQIVSLPTEIEVQLATYIKEAATASYDTDAIEILPVDRQNIHEIGQIQSGDVQRKPSVKILETNTKSGRINHPFNGTNKVETLFENDNKSLHLSIRTSLVSPETSSESKNIFEESLPKFVDVGVGDNNFVIKDTFSATKFANDNIRGKVVTIFVDHPKMVHASTNPTLFNNELIPNVLSLPQRSTLSKSVQVIPPISIIVNNVSTCTSSCGSFPAYPIQEDKEFGTQTSLVVEDTSYQIKCYEVVDAVTNTSIISEEKSGSAMPEFVLLNYHCETADVAVQVKVEPLGDKADAGIDVQTFLSAGKGTKSIFTDVATSTTLMLQKEEKIDVQKSLLANMSNSKDINDITPSFFDKPSLRPVGDDNIQVLYMPKLFTKNIDTNTTNVGMVNVSISPRTSSLSKMKESCEKCKSKLPVAFNKTCLIDISTDKSSTPKYPKKCIQKTLCTPDAVGEESKTSADKGRIPCATNKVKPKRSNDSTKNNKISDYKVKEYVNALLYLHQSPITDESQLPRPKRPSCSTNYNNSIDIIGSNQNRPSEKGKELDAKSAQNCPCSPSSSACQNRMIATHKSDLTQRRSFKNNLPSIDEIKKSGRSSPPKYNSSLGANKTSAKFNNNNNNNNNSSGSKKPKQP